ncbi:Molybdopterin or thiamine biosynthesis adenylyltransferase [Yoonia tamlensis]|uniref:Molybdopterin-synthase adenylyltransferase n=1 Tax=Yoonia tamlensis TaxID=390270 RepID=A0A1I6GWE5_9RHOB|nr:molybdopterin-synthase adenylyltransferase MoeB [Yoonia tamlensis]SFR46508.1 Molybdopterin or thiamine biosynthesis adenylyltransferase [Yoonia tamlensis]
MIMVGAMAAALWGIGILMGAPMRARWTMLLLLIGAVIAGHLVLPDGHPLRMATGGDARLWALMIAFGVIIAGYRNLLGRLKARAPDHGTKALKSDSFSDTELDRYARHIILREVGGPGQKALRNARVLVVGAGGLGAPALQYLAAAGVGTIGVIDDDHVENANLHRQIIHQDRNIGMPKVHSAAEAMRAQNPFVTVNPYHRRLTDAVANDLFADYDLILDGTDNFDTRYLVNRTAVALGKPLIAAALTQWEGQISLYDPAAGAPCYACVFPDAPDPALVPSCAEAGVIGPLPGVIGAMMALEAVKQITGAGDGLAGRLLIYDALYAQTRVIAVKPRADCAVCGGKGLHAKG